MEVDICRSHILMEAEKLHSTALVCPRVANKYAFESARGELG